MQDPEAPQGSGGDLPEPTGPPDGSRPDPPVMEVGEAGPPSKMSSTSKLPKGADGSMMPVQGFAGAPGLVQVFIGVFLCSAALFQFGNFEKLIIDVFPLPYIVHLTAPPNVKFTAARNPSMTLVSGKHGFCLILLL